MVELMAKGLLTIWDKNIVLKVYGKIQNQTKEF